MSKVQPPSNFSNVQEWKRFLKEGAYRGYKINRLAVKLEQGEIGAIDYLKGNAVIQASSLTTGRITHIFVNRIDKGFWSWFPRWNHQRKMKNLNSRYTQAFEARMEKLAEKLAALNQRDLYYSFKEK